MIELTGTGGEVVYVNPSQVDAIQPAGEFTNVIFSGWQLRVKQDINEVRKRMESVR